MEISMSCTNAPKIDLDEIFQTLAAIRTLSDPIDLGEQIIIPAAEISLSFAAGSGRTVDGEKDVVRERFGSAGIAAITPQAVVSVSRKCSGRNGIRVLAISQTEDQIPAAIEI